MQHYDLWNFATSHKTEIALSVFSFAIIAFARQIWSLLKLLFLHVYKAICATKGHRLKISKQIVEMNADAICMVLQILQTQPAFSDFVQYELVLFDQQISRQLIPMASRLRGMALSLKKRICRNLGNDVSNQVDLCVIAIEEVADWHYPAMTYTSLRTRCLKALVDWQSLMKSILVDDAIKEWADEHMAEHCFQRGISDKTPLCGYDNPGEIFNSRPTMA